MKWQFIVIAVLILIGGGAFVMSSSKDDTANNSNQTATTERSSIEKLIERGDNLECTFEHTDESGARNTGMAYFSDNRMFGDFSVTTAEGETLQSNVLNLGDMQYVWDNDKKEGYKINTADFEATVEGEEAQTDAQDDEFDFSCKKWSVDESKFDVPSDVNFVDNSSLFDSFETQLESVDDVCAEIEDPGQKQACEQAVSR